MGWTALRFVIVKGIVTKTRNFLLFINRHSYGLLKKSFILSYLTVMLFCCKCVFFVEVFQENLFTDRADESNKLKCIMYNFINWVSLNQCQMSRNHSSSVNRECFRKICNNVLNNGVSLVFIVWKDKIF